MSPGGPLPDLDALTIPALDALIAEFKAATDARATDESHHYPPAYCHPVCKLLEQYRECRDLLTREDNTSPVGLALLAVQAKLIGEISDARTSYYD